MMQWAGGILLRRGRKALLLVLFGGLTVGACSGDGTSSAGAGDAGGGIESDTGGGTETGSDGDADGDKDTGTHAGGETETGIGETTDRDTGVDTLTEEDDGGNRADGGGDTASETGPGDPLPSTDPCPEAGRPGDGGVMYYVCNCLAGADAACVAGDDGNDGTDSRAPWQTLEKARSAFGSLRPGETIAFCRGGSFDAVSGGRWVNASCLADNPCIVRDYTPEYADEDTAKPLITSAGDVFRFEDGGNANHEEGYLFMHLSLSSTNGEGQGVFIYNDMDDVVLCDLDIDGFNLGVHVAGSNPPEEGSDARNERIEIRRSRIANSPGQGYLGSCNDCVIAYNYFENNGFAEAVFNHNIYVSGAAGERTRGIRVIGNELYRSAVIDGECRGVSLVVHGQHDDIVIADNLVREDPGAAEAGCWGIAMDTGYGEPEAFSNAVVRGNTVVNVGNMGIGLNACDTCVIENNVVVFDQDFGATAIAVPDRDRAADDLPMTSITVRNNTVYFPSDQRGTGIRLGGEGTNHNVVSNAVYYGGTGDGFNCFDMDLAPAAYDAVDHNLCYAPNTSEADWESAVGSLAEWQAATGLDGSSLVADPVFVSIADGAYDLRPTSAASPLVDHGHPQQSSAMDLTGQARDASPDIGAYEYRD